MLYFKVEKVEGLYRVSRIDGGSFPYCGAKGCKSVDFMDADAAAEKALIWDLMNLRD